MSKKKKSIKEEYDELMNLFEPPELKAQIRELQERALAQAREHLRAVYAAAAAHPNKPIPYDEFGNCIMAIPKEEWQAQQKTAFLQDLSELLRKYDAKIGFSYGEHEKYGWCEYPTLTIDNKTLTYAGCDDGELTADNVLNYDK